MMRGGLGYKVGRSGGLGRGLCDGRGGLWCRDGGLGVIWVVMEASATGGGGVWGGGIIRGP